MRFSEPYTIFLRTLKSGKKVYYVRYRRADNTRSPALSLGTDKISDAKRKARQFYDDGLFKIYESAKFSVYTLHFFDDDSKYVLWSKANGTPIKQSTLASYRTKLMYQLAPFFNEYKLSDITVNDIKKWVIWASEKWSPKTINNAQGVLSIIFNQALEENLIRFSPLRTIKYRKVEKISRKLLTIEELSGIYNSDCIDQNYKKAILVLAVTGMREGELCAIRKESLRDDCIEVKHNFSFRFGIGSTKTGIDREVPIIPEIYKILKTDNDFVFQDDDGGPMHPHNLYNAFMRSCESIGIDTKERKITVHTLRNWFASRLEEHGIQKYMIRAALGHSDRDVTDHYVYWTKDMFSDIYNIQKDLFFKITQK